MQCDTGRVRATRRTRADVAGGWHSQFRQDILVLLLLNCKRAGFFIDLATNDPVEISNTRALERDFHWRGLCIEPNVKYHRAIWERRSCTLVPNAITTSRGQVSFTAPKVKKVWGFDSGAFGQIVDPSRAPRDDETAWTVPSLPFSDVLSAIYVPPTIDYLSLDVEGAEELVMSTFPWLAHNITIMSVERPSRALQRLLRSHGYRRLSQSQYHSANDDTMWIHPSLSDSTISTRMGQHGVACACSWQHES